MQKAVFVIVALAKNNVIGNSNSLPWYLPADLKHFKEITLGSSVIMGRKTLESILQKLGSPLRGRENIVITHDPAYHQPGVITATSLEQAVSLASKQKIFVIGGAQIYHLGLRFAHKLFITEVHADVAGDTFFPKYNLREWREVAREDHKKDNRNPYDFSFVIKERI